MAEKDSTALTAEPTDLMGKVVPIAQAKKAKKQPPEQRPRKFSSRAELLAARARFKLRMQEMAEEQVGAAFDKMIRAANAEGSSMGLVRFIHEFHQAIEQQLSRYPPKIIWARSTTTEGQS